MDGYNSRNYSMGIGIACARYASEGAGLFSFLVACCYGIFLRQESPKRIPYRGRSPLCI